jgi:predicted transcriptional regulator
VRPVQVVREVLDQMVDRLFGGETIPLFQHLIQDRGLSNDEIKKLRAMLDELEGER